MDKIKKKLRLSTNNAKIYFLAQMVLNLQLIFVILTTILQTNWFGYKEQMPILSWIVAKPYVGIFFLPFMILATYVCWFICATIKPATIQQAKGLSINLLEQELIDKETHDLIYELYSKQEIKNKKEYLEKLEKIKKENQERAKNDSLQDKEKHN